MPKKKPTLDITSMLNIESIKEATTIRKRIHYTQLVPHEKNHYSLEYIEELADSIEDVGLLQDVIVKPIENEPDKYTIIAGHRRRLALKILVEKRDLEKYANVPCVLLDSNEDELLTQLKLHITNTTTRELTEHDKMTAIAELKEIIEEARKRGYSIKGKTRDIIADNVNLGKSQVQKYVTINEKATNSVKEALKKGEITVSEAYQATQPKKDKKVPPSGPLEKEEIIKDITLKAKTQIDKEGATEWPPNENREGQNVDDAIVQAISTFKIFKEAIQRLETNTDFVNLLETIEEHLDSISKR
ncbi:MAG: ParB N-terminal domain-containing protein [Defluviitaleaceae bacterium]|nr:ParB N-terminal domain-containing protein [Defluviitaleaceae bacterium]